MASVVLVLQAICVKLSSMISGRFALFTRNHEQTDKEEKKTWNWFHSFFQSHLQAFCFTWYADVSLMYWPAQGKVMIYTDQSSDQRDVQRATWRFAHTDQPLDTGWVVGRSQGGGVNGYRCQWMSSECNCWTNLVYNVLKWKDLRLRKNKCSAIIVMKCKLLYRSPFWRDISETTSPVKNHLVLSGSSFHRPSLSVSDKETCFFHLISWIEPIIIFAIIGHFLSK